MARTVDDLRNDIRIAVDRFERIESTGFTKETLAAICESVGYDIDGSQLPSTAQMRAGIRSRVGRAESDDPEAAGGQFREADLEAIAESVGATD